MKEEKYSYKWEGRVGGPGVYLVGDPCYAFNESWLAVLESWYDNSGAFTRADIDYPVAVESNPLGAGVFPVPGRGCNAMALSTGFGDGTLYSDKGDEFGIDAGMFGVVPECVVERSSGMTAYCIASEAIVKLDNGKVTLYDGDKPVVSVRLGGND